MRACQELMDQNIQTKGEYFLADALQPDDRSREKSSAHRRWTSGKTAASRKPCCTPTATCSNTATTTAPSISGNGYLVVPPVHIASTAVIQNSVIGPYATISDGCHITGSIIRDSIIDEDALIRRCDARSIAHRQGRSCQEQLSQAERGRFVLGGFQLMKAQQPMETVTVECYSGARFAERPVALTWRGERLQRRSRSSAPGKRPTAWALSCALPTVAALSWSIPSRATSGRLAS